MTTVRYILEANGVFKKETTEVRVVNVSDDVFNKLAARASVQIRNIARAPNGGRVHLSTKANDFYWTVEMPTLKIKAPFLKLNGDDGGKDDGVLVPHFDQDGSKVTEMSLEWTPPLAMKLYSVVLTQETPGAGYMWTNIWFFASDKDNKIYRLPLPNTYDDCSMCHGQKSLSYTSHLEAVGKILEAFEASYWNSDLWKSREQTERMFRFRLTDKGSETVAPSTRNFWSMCVVVAPGIYENIML